MSDTVSSVLLQRPHPTCYSPPHASHLFWNCTENALMEGKILKRKNVTIILHLQEIKFLFLSPRSTCEAAQPLRLESQWGRFPVLLLATHRRTHAPSLGTDVCGTRGPSSGPPAQDQPHRRARNSAVRVAVCPSPHPPRPRAPAAVPSCSSVNFRGPAHTEAMS